MSIKVLVADDSITIQKVIGIIFGGEEYSLTVVDNGKAAVEKAREINPDVLLIDALMPGMTGYEVAEMVRSTPSIAAKPILLLTGSFEPFDEEKAKKCGADDFISKPFESQQIISKVKELLEIGKARAAATVAAPPVQQQEAPLVNDIPAPDFEFNNEPPQVDTPSDIWGAFTTEDEVTAPIVEPVAPIAQAASQASAPVPTPVQAAPAVAAFEPDVFAIVSEEADSQIISSAPIENTVAHQTGSQWIPVEENTFEFEEESISEPPQSAFTVTEKASPVVEASFGEIVFDEADEIPPTPAFTEAPKIQFTAPKPDFSAPAPDFSDFASSTKAVNLDAFEPLPDPEPVELAPPKIFQEIPPVNVVPVVAAPTTVVDPVTPVAPVSLAPSATLTEEQIKSVIAGLSKEVIERIVWEVVPDLADTMIREAIRKIKEGV